MLLAVICELPQRRGAQNAVAARTNSSGHSSIRKCPQSSIAVDIDDSFGERFRSLLRDIVTDALQDSVRILSRELLSIGGAVRGRTIEIAANRDCGHIDDRSLEEPLFKMFVGWLAFGQTQPPAVIVDDDAHVIRVVERRRGTIKRSIIKAPLGRGVLPDELVEITPIFSVAELASFSGEVILVPPS